MTQGVSDLMRLLRQRSQTTPDASPSSEAASATIPTADPNNLAQPDDALPAAAVRSEAAQLPHAESPDTTSNLHLFQGSPAPGYRLAAVPVDLIQIDPHQPRRTLPDDLRQTCAQDKLSNRDTIFELCRRAQLGDGLAAKRVARLRELADSIHDVGLEYPPKVRTIRVKDNTIGVRYRLIDGERRFWAWMLLLASADEAERAYRESIPVMVAVEDVDAEHVLRSQWATNLRREAVSVVDIADYILSVRDTYAARLQVDPRQWMAALGESGRDMSVPEAVTELTVRDIGAVMGWRLSRASLLRYVAIAEKLSSDVKAIARVKHFGLRQCDWLARLSPVHQLEAAERMKSNDDNTVERQDEAQGRPRTTGAGRPKLLDGRITLLVRVAGDIGRDKEANLRKADPVKLQELRQATADAIGALQGYVRLIDRSLADVGPARPTDKGEP